jgi:hypothetical protein
MEFREIFSDEFNNRQSQQNKTLYSTLAVIEHFTDVSSEPIWRCDGTIICSKGVITTARCANAANLGAVRKRVITQSANLEVLRTFVHQKYNAASGDNDIAMLVVKRYIEFSETVSPACPWYNQTHLPLFLSKPILSADGNN